MSLKTSLNTREQNEVVIVFRYYCFPSRARFDRCVYLECYTHTPKDQFITVEIRVRRNVECVLHRKSKFGSKACLTLLTSSGVASPAVFLSVNVCNYSPKCFSPCYGREQTNFSRGLGGGKNARTLLVFCPLLTD